MGNIPREFFSDPKSPQCKAERTAENVGIGIGIIVALTLIFAPIFFFACEGQTEACLSRSVPLSLKAKGEAL